MYLLEERTNDMITPDCGKYYTQRIEKNESVRSKYLIPCVNHYTGNYKG